MEDLKQALSERILILDGAMGTMLQRHGLSGNNEFFNLSRPDIVREIHRAYIEAGADIITTNTFSANRISLAEYGCADQARALARSGAALAREASGAAPRRVWVAGSLGPTGKSLTLAQDLSDPAFRPVSFDEMAEAYDEQIRGLLEGGVDALLLETCFDALNAKAAIYAVSGIPEAAALPLLISVSVSDRSGRTLTGQTLEAFYRSVQHARPLCFGLNCSLGADALAPLVADVASWTDCAVSCYPNAGLPNEMGQYDETPVQTAASLGRMARAGLLNLAGGCCGTTPEHIRTIAEALRGLPPRGLPEPDRQLHLSGLETVTVDVRKSRFTNIGERTNVAGSRKFARLIAAGDYDTALQVAADQIGNGASVIDVNMDDAMLDSRAQMQRFLRHIAGEPAVARAALMIDASHWETLLAGLKNAQGRSIVNSISLKEGEESFLSRAREIRRLGAAVVVMAFDEQGQATTYDRKIAICRRAFRLLTEQAGYNPWDIIFDVNVLSIGTGIPEHARYGVDFIEAVRWIKQNLPGALTSGGISNLSFAFRGNNAVREAMHSVFLYHAIAAGLDMGIVNSGMLKVYDEIDPALRRAVEDVILDRDAAATERLIGLAQEIGTLQENRENSEATADSACLPVDERLIRALVSGGSRQLQEDLLASLAQNGRALDVIEGPLMAGMARVGELFAAGKMFLPQVVKSAKVMSDAVAFLQPYMGGEDADARKSRFLLATVKGDVHDIGKNITGIVLRCNGFEVIDLGVMVPGETILEQADALAADIIGVSGLITPSLFQMEELCREMAARNLSTPLLIGGATTSPLHTAIKLAPLYDHVFYAPDASACAVLAGRLMTDRERTEAEEHGRQEALRKLHEERQAKSALRSAMPGVTAHRPPFPADSYLRGKFFTDIPARELSVAEVLPFFDWKIFSAIWGIRQPGPDLESAADTLDRLKADAADRLASLRREGGCRICIAVRFDACHAKDDDILAAGWHLPMLRQESAEGRSLADFVAPEEYGFDSPMGMFAVSVHPVTAGCQCEACTTDYDSLLDRSIRLTLAEAASCWLDRHLKKQLPEASPVRIVKPAAGYGSCPDHTLKRDILALLPDASRLGIRLTESCAMIPDASICGLIFAHPSASYPDIRHLSHAAVDAYASRRGFSTEEIKTFLGHLF